MWAVQEGHQAVVKLLLAKGANVHIKDKDGFTAKDYALDFGYPEIAQWL